MRPAHVQKRPVVCGGRNRLVTNVRAPRAHDVRMVVRGDPVGGRRPVGHTRDAWPREHHAQIPVLLVNVHARVLSEHARRRVGQPVHQPLLAEVVVDDQHAVRLQPCLDRAEGLLGEHETLEPHGREARLQRQRVDEREHHQVVLLRGRPQEVPGIVGDDVDAGIVERPVGMMLPAQLHDDRIDLHRVHVVGAVQQCRSDVGARAGPQDQHALERVAEHRVRPLVEVLLLFDRRHRLVEDVVDLHHRLLRLGEGGDLVVRRPHRPRREAVDDADRHRQHDDARDGQRPTLLEDEGQGGQRRNAEPHGGRQLQRRHQAEGCDAEQAAGQVPEVGAQRRRLIGHLLPHPLRQQHEEQRDGAKQHRQEPRALDGHHLLGRAAREVDAGGGLRHRDVDAHERHDAEQRRQHRRKPRQQSRADGRQQAADTDAEEARQQDEVREVGEQPDVGRHPADESHLQEQHQERDEKEPCGGRPQKGRRTNGHASDPTSRGYGRTSAAPRWWHPTR